MSNKGINGKCCHGNKELLLAMVQTAFGSTSLWLKMPRHLPSSLYLLQPLRRLFGPSKSSSKFIFSSNFQGKLFALRFRSLQVLSFSHLEIQTELPPIALQFFSLRMSKVWPCVCVASQEARKKMPGIFDCSLSVMWSCWS